MILTEEDSLNNYLDYKEEIEYRLFLDMGNDDLEAVDLAVIKELYTMDLINYEFYMRQCETIKTVHKYSDNQSRPLVCLLEVLLLSGLMLGGIVALSKYKFIDLPFVDEL
jgi:hypothetical protein